MSANVLGQIVRLAEKVMLEVDFRSKNGVLNSISP